MRATEGTLKGFCLYWSDEMVLVGEVEIVTVSDCDGITSTRDGSLKESVAVSRKESGTAGPVNAVPVGVGVSGDRDGGDLGDISTSGGRTVRGVERTVS